MQQRHDEDGEWRCHDPFGLRDDDDAPESFGYGTIWIIGMIVVSCVAAIVWSVASAKGMPL